ncbi:hypothetical protein Y032_0972g3254 [Ancylostoma ceylanicum]|uniref:Uncharacterized protein n=1 Tax=Ancylostoma ceylanicum TaxID=53326 RepID=A0A016W877_9BILA|nr:hypothetical protein Y032_0972g3254 [Ancylostoma ceylanicum]
MSTHTTGRQNDCGAAKSLQKFDESTCYRSAEVEKYNNTQVRRDGEEGDEDTELNLQQGMEEVHIGELEREDEREVERGAGRGFAVDRREGSAEAGAERVDDQAIAGGSSDAQ